MFPALEHAVRKIFLAGRKRKHFSTLAPGPCAQRGRNLAEKTDTQELLSLEICQNNILRKNMMNLLGSARFSDKRMLMWCENI